MKSLTKLEPIGDQNEKSYNFERAFEVSETAFETSTLII